MKKYLMPIFALFFLVFNHDLIVYIDITDITDSIQQLMTSQTTSYIEY